MSWAPWAARLAVLVQVQIEREILDIGEDLIPLVERLHVHGADFLIALVPEVGHQAAADKSAGAGYDNEFIFHCKCSSAQFAKPYRENATRIRKNRM